MWSIKKTIKEKSNINIRQSAIHLTHKSIGMTNKITIYEYKKIL